MGGEIVDFDQAEDGLVEAFHDFGVRCETKPPLRRDMRHLLDLHVVTHGTEAQTVKAIDAAKAPRAKRLRMGSLRMEQNVLMCGGKNFWILKRN